MRQSKHFIIWIGTGILAILLGYGIATRPEETIITALIVTAALIFSAKPMVGLITCLFLPVIGELYRLPLGGDNGTLISDIVVPVFAATWVVKMWLTQKRWPTSKLITPLIAFTAIAAISLIQALLFLTPSEVISGSLYLIRLVSYVLLGIITFDSLKKSTQPHSEKTPDHAAKTLIKATVISAILIAAAGFIQLVIYPDLTKIEALGWDPHINRLVSTWLDPNFVGGFLAFAISILIGLALHTPRTSRSECATNKGCGNNTHARAAASVLPTQVVATTHGAERSVLPTQVVATTHEAERSVLLTKVVATTPTTQFPIRSFTLLITLLTAALFFTYSRSAYVAMAVAIVIIGLLKSRKLLIAGILIALIGMGLSPRVEQRVTDLIQSAASLVSNTGENPDATARLRIQSWEQTLSLIAKRPFFGSGYNTLRSVNYNEGFVSNTDIHSASGSDSSLLTILATTGIFGLIPFLWLYFQIPVFAWKNWRNKKLPPYLQGHSLGIFAGFTALFVHAFFVNGLLFPHLLIFLWIQAGILEWTSHSSSLEN